MYGQGLYAQGAMAQATGSSPTINYDESTGAVQVDINAFDLRTGPLENDSKIPLPAGIIESTQQGVAQPVFSDRFAPNTIEVTPDVDYIEQSLNRIATDEGQDSAGYVLRTESLRLNTQFNVRTRPGTHSYAEGIEVTVTGPNGEIKSREAAFVRGENVNVDANNQPLPTSEEVDAVYGAEDTVELRVLNIRRNGATPRESGIYFDRVGGFDVEDLQNGGDLDFDDGNYSQVSSGRGEAIAIEETTQVSTETKTTETALEPETRQEEVVETEEISNAVGTETVVEETSDSGSIDISDAAAAELGHASGARSENGEQLLYGRYAGGSQVRLGSDGLGATLQLEPLANNPNIPPTLINGHLNFNPTVGDNQAGLSATVSVTQFLSPTHRVAQDAFGNEIKNLDPSGSRLLTPAGLFNNRRLVGYVPPTVEQQPGNAQLSSVNGIFDLPLDQSIVILPPNAQQVGPGRAAYTDNVGGLLIEGMDGSVSFLSQWAKDGYAQTPVTLGAGEAARIIYALVPQQPGQALQSGQRYAVSQSDRGYQIAEGGFTVISADQQPQNFVQETAEVYAVEDTLPSRENAITSLFNGIRGIYAEVFGGDRVPTVDVNIPTEVDARVGNALTLLETVVSDAGQRAYEKTTLAGGFYLGGSLSAGIGNQRDTTTITNSTITTFNNELRTQRTLNTFLVPRVQRDSFTLQTTETTRAENTASFDINNQGLLTNVNFFKDNSPTTEVSTLELDRISTIESGAESLIDSVTEEDTITVDSQRVLTDQVVTTESRTNPNFSPVQGELALGGVLNFGNTPWTPAANTLRAELFARNTVFGRGNSGTPVGLRAEVVFHPFGEVQREAYQYDEAGNVVPIYATEAVMDADGQPMKKMLADENGQAVELAVNRYAVDEGGDRIAQTVGTGRAKGPGIYLRLEDIFSDDDGMEIAGGLQFTF